MACPARIHEPFQPTQAPTVCDLRLTGALHYVLDAPHDESLQGEFRCACIKNFTRKLVDFNTVNGNSNSGSLN